MPRFGPVFRLITVAGAIAWTTGCGETTPPPPPNKFPYATARIPPMNIFIGDTVTTDLSEHFTDPDGDELSYSATSSNPAVATVSVTGATMRIVALAKDTAIIKVTATDDEDASAELTVRVTVGNRAPAVVDSTTVERYVGQKVALVLSNYFTDPDGDPITYTAVSSDEGIVAVSLSGDTMQVEAASRGEARITVTATDTDSLSTQMLIPVTVVPIPERVVLEFLYNAAGGAAWGHSDNWLTNTDLANWYGVEVNEQGEVRALSLGDNNLKGTIPPQLGGLVALDYLDLQSNELEGGIPASLGRLPLLSELHLTNNPGLAGEIPDYLRRELTGLDALLAGGTALCAPNQSEFRRWLDGIPERRVKMCERELPAAYLIQAAQSPADTFPMVSLVGGKAALLRVFVTSSHATHEGLPPVRARFHVDEKEIHTVTVPDTTTAIPVTVMENSLRRSVNVRIPSDVIQPDLEMVVEIDPEGTLDDELGVAARIPEKGRREYKVYTLPTFELTVIPFLWESNPDSAILDYTKKMEEEKEENSRLHATYDLLPTGDFEVTQYDAVETSSNSAFDLLAETDVIRKDEGTGGYFQGQMSGSVTGAAGVAWLAHKSSFSVPRNLTISHELGHNQNLRHAPCGGATGPDPNFPHDDGKIGIWGYDYRGERLMNPDTYDMMSYCGPQWISDYYFDKALRYRIARERAWFPSVRTRTLLLWGGLDEQGKPFLKPAFVMETLPEPPIFPGAYSLTGRDHEGADIFSFSFDMPEIADGDGRSAFVFTLPVQADWAGSLASITLSGPGGSFTLDGDTDSPMTIARDGMSGRIRAFWSGWRTASADRPELVLLRSRGIPGLEEWER